MAANDGMPAKLQFPETEQLTLELEPRTEPHADQADDPEREWIAAGRPEPVPYGVIPYRPVAW